MLLLQCFMVLILFFDRKEIGNNFISDFVEFLQLFTEILCYFIYLLHDLLKMSKKQG